MRWQASREASWNVGFDALVGRAKILGRRNRRDVRVLALNAGFERNVFLARKVGADDTFVCRHIEMEIANLKSAAFLVYKAQPREERIRYVTYPKDEAARCRRSRKAPCVVYPFRS